VKIEVLYFHACPNHEELLRRPRESAAEADISAHADLRGITDEETARSERFLGSPAAHVDGHDIEEGAERRTDFGVKRRLHRRATGLSGQPNDAWLRVALHRAARAGT
jgi:hypothetical protein